MSLASVTSLDHRTTSVTPSKLKTYGFIIAIIIGMAGFIVGAVGLAGYFHVGALMAQFDAIIMMAIGGGGGAILLIGLVSTIKNQRSGNHNISRGSEDIGAHRAMTKLTSTTSMHVDPLRGSATRTSDSAESVYGPEAWKRWKNIEIVDVIPSVPVVDLSKKNQILLYIPRRIKFNGKEQNLTLKVLKEIVGNSFGYLSSNTEQQFGDSPAAGGWVLIDKTVIPESRGKNYEVQQKMAEERGYSLPSALEAAILNLMVFDLTRERLYGYKPWTYTRCLEKVDGQYPVIVGGLSAWGLYVSSPHFDDFHYGASCVRRKF